jgi:hypothetical protein
LVSAFFSTSRPYLAWTLLSAAWLVVAAFIDPYVLGFSFYATAGVSVLLVLAALVISPRHWLWALVGGVPTGLALLLLSTYRWA